MNMDIDIDTELIEAIKLGDFDKTRELISAGANVYRDNDAALREAVSQRNVEIINFLIYDKYGHPNHYNRALEHVENDLEQQKTSKIEVMKKARQNMDNAAIAREAGIEIEI